MKHSVHLLLTLLTAFLVGLSMLPVSAAVSTHGAASARQDASLASKRSNDRYLVKQGSFSQLIKQFRKSRFGKQWTLEQDSEKASAMATFSIVFLLGSLFLLLVYSVSPIFSLGLGTFAIILLLANIILNLIILFSKPNKKSKAIAKAILIIITVNLLAYLLALVLITAVCPCD